MSYEDERVESWARKLYERVNPTRVPWASINHGYSPEAERWRHLARLAIEIHLGCCEQRCGKCKAVFVHWCASCDRS